MQITVFFVSYGYETWSFILREARRLGMFHKQYAEEDIWVKEGQNSRILKKYMLRSFKVSFRH